MKIKEMALLLSLFLPLQGCVTMSVSVDVSPIQSKCLKQIVYILPEPGSGFDTYTYNQLMTRNSSLETGLKTYPDSYRYFTASRYSQENADLKMYISIAAYVAGAVLFALPRLESNAGMGGNTAALLTYSGSGIALCGVVLRFMSMMDNYDSRQSLKKSVDYYNRHCY